MQGSLGALGNRGQNAQGLFVFHLLMCYLQVHYFLFFKMLKEVMGLGVARPLCPLTLEQIGELALSTVLGSEHLGPRQVESRRLVGWPSLL